MPTNFELKRLKPELNIVKKPENREHIHKLKDSNALSILVHDFTKVDFGRV